MKQVKIHGDFNQVLTEGENRIWEKEVKEKEKRNRAYNDYSSEALIEFTSVPPRIISCQAEVCSAGSTRGEDGTNSLLSHFCSLFAAFLLHKGSSVRRDGWCVAGWSKGGSQQPGWNCFRLHWWLFNLSLTTNNFGKISAIECMIFCDKVLLI